MKTFLITLTLSSAFGLPPQENTIFQHGSNIINDPNYWDDFSHELQSHEGNTHPGLSPEVLKSVGRAALADVYHEHEAVEAAREAATHQLSTSDTTDETEETEETDETEEPRLNEISTNEPMAMGDVGENLMGLLGSIFDGPAHPPLMIDPSSPPFLRGGGGRPAPFPRGGGGRPGGRPSYGRSGFPSGLRPIIPRAPNNNFWRHPSFRSSVGRPPVPSEPLYAMPTGVRPPMRLSVGVPPPPVRDDSGVMPPHLPLGRPIQHLSLRLPLGTVIGLNHAAAEQEEEAKEAEEAEEAEEDEHELEEAPAKLSKMMDQIVAEEKKVANDKEKEKEIKKEDVVATGKNKIKAEKKKQKKAAVAEPEIKSASAVMKMLQDKAQENVAKMLQTRKEAEEEAKTKKTAAAKHKDKTTNGKKKLL